MRIDSRTIGVALLSVAPRVIAQGAPGCVPRGAAAASTRRDSPVIVVNGQIVPDSTPFVANTGMGFLARGSGELFGITGYRCPACQTKREPGHPPEDSFFAEPVVVSVSTSTPVKPGDVIEAVNDQPITTSAGARQFTHPAAGPNTLTVRRGRDRMVLQFDVPAPAPCPDSTTFRITGRVGGNVNFDSARVGQPPGNQQPGASIRIRGTSTLLSGPIYVIDGVRVEPSSVPPPTRYGFALSCENGCAKVTNPDGATFYRYNGPPTISAIRDASPAAQIGLKVGDVIVKIDGLSILGDDAAIRLAHAEQKSSLHVTVLRDGKEIGYLLQASK
jgi:hypothetical protein